MLKVGDKITKSFNFPLLKKVVTEVFVLRPPADGSCLVPIEGDTLDREIL